MNGVTGAVPSFLSYGEAFDILNAHRFSSDLFTSRSRAFPPVKVRTHKKSSRLGICPRVGSNQGDRPRLVRPRLIWTLGRREPFSTAEVHLLYVFDAWWLEELNVSHPWLKVNNEHCKRVRTVTYRRYWVNDFTCGKQLSRTKSLGFGLRAAFCAPKAPSENEIARKVRTLLS